MSYSNQTTQNKSFIKRNSHLKRFNVLANLINLKDEDIFLDYGTGNGYLLTLLATNQPNAEIVGYDPIDWIFEELRDNINTSGFKNIKACKKLSDIETLKFNKINCSEVLEHFSESKQIEHIKTMCNLLDDNGSLFFSVPIETGLTALIKNIVRVATNQRHSNFSVKNVLRSVFYLKVDRKNDEYINSHIGFNHKEFEKLLINQNLVITKTAYSPFNFLKGFLNSQVFYVLKKY